MEEIIKLITDNGIGIVCVGVVLYDHLVNNKKMLSLMDQLKDTLSQMCVRLVKIEDKLHIHVEESEEE